MGTTRVTSRARSGCGGPQPSVSSVPLCEMQVKYIVVV